MVDENPSQEDIERFSTHETGYCPHCGDEIWDDATQCPSCNTWIQHNISHRDPTTNDFRKRTIVVIVIVVLIAFLYGANQLLWIVS